MRSQLRHVVQDQAGNVRSGRSVEIFNYGTTTPISNTMYPTATSSTVLNPNTLVTSTLGEVEVWIDGLSAPVDVRIGGVTGTTETVYFAPDPATLALASALPSAILTNQGDIIVATAPLTAGRLGIGTAFQELVVNAGATALQWASGVLARATAAGDIFQATGANAIARLPIGTARQNLAVNPGATALEYVASLQSLIQVAGDIIQGSGANAAARLAIGAAFQNLQVNAGATALNYAASLQSLISAAGDLIVGSAANTPARLAKGADGTYLGVAAGVVGWIAGVNAALTTAEAALSGNVSLNNTANFFDGPSVSLTAGTWHLTGTVLVNDSAGASDIIGKLWDGSTVESSVEIITSTSNLVSSLSLSGIVTVGSTTTWKISCRDVTSTSGVISAATIGISQGNNASYLRGVKIG